MVWDNLPLRQAVHRLETEHAETHASTNHFSFHRDTPAISIKDIIPISHPKLIAYVRARKIDLDLANKYCREIHYQNNAQNYFSIGFANDNGGYELSSPPNFKGCIPPKAITTFRNSHDSCLVFEGFWDFLSCLTLQKIDKTKHDIAVLNSVANVRKAMDFLKTHREIYTYLDNDESGRKATALIQQANATVHNRSVKYAEYKDLNDYLCHKPVAKSVVPKRKIGLKQ
jgi:hypothetical protein